MPRANQYPYRWRDLPRLIAALTFMAGMMIIIYVLGALRLYRQAIAVCDAVDRVRVWADVDARRKR